MEGEARFWAMFAEEQDGHLQPYGKDTVAIVDDEDGGVIAYVHSLNTTRFLDALRAQAGVSA